MSMNAFTDSAADLIDSVNEIVAGGDMPPASEILTGMVVLNLDSVAENLSRIADALERLADAHGAA